MFRAVCVAEDTGDRRLVDKASTCVATVDGVVHIVGVVVIIAEEGQLPAVAGLQDVPHALRESGEAARLVTTAGREKPIHMQDRPVAPIAQLGGIIQDMEVVRALECVALGHILTLDNKHAPSANQAHTRIRVDNPAAPRALPVDTTTRIWV